ncbi:2-oxo acid dehydrogenase subunit E2 [Chryseotalea sanaruensis]|uniref:Dihydrolipoamide acetyltransferase component of pyruvate dehydrogenase complex n=1 Tax=Chryseotalea sanaruensis TaxID=2482724 RepID=A0A401U630_9BACT|nr:dihydrolipoamide acetyltransferase family protein [Chryseotalea sanaruensis]GCC50381.1 2-oxo acid dehydrogenase subunit E2 [Chryseotalea sanaruensis]
MIDFRMPSLGADMESAFLREWKVKPGDVVKRGDIIAEVETQKGIIDIEVFNDGIIGDLLVKIDEKVPVGTLMTQIFSLEEVKTEVKKSGEAEVPKEKPNIHLEVHRASPLAKRIAAEKGIDLSLVKGTGTDGAITREDVDKVVVEQTSPKATSTKTAGENIRAAVAAAMSKSNREIPHYYLQTKVDMSGVLNWLAQENKQRGVKDRLLPIAPLIKAVAKALVEIPDLNAWWENGLQRKSGINIGFVVSLRTGGIIVPAIHDADKKSVGEIMQTLTDIISRVRSLKLRSSDLSDSTITITSLGDGAVETVYGVIYPPQVALVSFGGITDQPWADNGMLGVRPVLNIGLAADHRASDGNTGNLFLTLLKNLLKKPDLL